MAKRMFDSTAKGMIRYFVRPNDDFVMNSLEKLNCDAYLYRLLKADGYERIVFFEVDETNCKIYAYDKLSHLSIMNPDDFRGVDLANENSLISFYEKVKKKMDKNSSGLTGIKAPALKPKETKIDISEYGKREVMHFDRAEKFISDFQNYISSALQASNIKTAIVMQMEIFEQTLHKEPDKASKTATQLANIISRNVKINSSKQNIIVFTTTQKGNFVNLLNNNLLHKLHSWTSEVLMDSVSGGERVNKALELLRDQDCLVLTDSIGVDEIANLLLRKRIIEEDPSFSGLGVSKIYPVAEALKEHLTQKCKCFSEIPFRESDEYIRSLNIHLTREEVVAEILRYANGVKPREVKVLNGIGSVYVERVTHIHTEYADNETVNEILSELDELVGMEYLKKQVIKILAKFKHDKAKYDEAVSIRKKPPKYPYMNMVFIGPPGTGKTTVADIVARLFCAEGILTNPEPMYRKPADYPTNGIADVLGGKIGSDLDKGNGGVVVIDEFYNFNRGHSGGNLADDAFSAIMDKTDKYKNTMCVIVAGYEKEMNEMFEQFNPGARRRFPYTLRFESYSTEDLLKIFKKIVGDIVVKEPAMNMVRKIIEAEKTSQKKTFGNAGFIEDTLIPLIDAEYIDRGEWDDEYTEADVENAFSKYAPILSKDNETVNDILSELDELVGMEYLKKQVIKTLTKFKHDKAKYDKAVSMRKKPPKYPYMNMVFIGPPGTGKTTVADIVARLFCAEGILTNPEPMYRKPADYPTNGIADVLGGKIGSDIDKGNGGVVVIDEFYNFNRGHSGGNLADDAFSAIMDKTDKYKNTMCVIVAGYEKEMNEMFEQFNPGARRRFPYTLRFESYSTEDLLKIFKKIVGDIVVKEPAMNMVRKIIEAEKTSQKKTFGNAGFIEDTLIPLIDAEYIDRGEWDDEYTEADVENAFPNYKENNRNTIQFEKVPGSLFSDLTDYYPVKEYSDANELHTVTEKAALFIKTNKGAGTAFLISPEGYALTCNHVIDGAAEINARLRIPERLGGSDSWHKCSVINANKEYDIALLKLEGDTFPYLNIAAPGRKITRGEHFMLSGYPFGNITAKDITTFYGRVSSSDLQTDDKGLIRYNINCEAKCGNSGAPIIALADGRVIGILLGSITNPSGDLKEEINHMRPLKYFWEEFLE